MKRFYCTVCKKMKRVRKYPLMTQNVESDTPANRVGICTRHTPSYQSFKEKNLVGHSGTKVAK